MNIKIQKILSLKKKQEDSKQKDCFINNNFFENSAQNYSPHQEKEVQQTKECTEEVNLKMQMIYQRYKSRYDFQAQFNQIEMNNEEQCQYDHDNVVQQIDEIIKSQSNDEKQLKNNKEQLLETISEFKLLQLNNLRKTIKPNHLHIKLYDILELIYGNDIKNMLTINYSVLQENSSLLEILDISNIVIQITQQETRLDDKKVQKMLSLIMISLKCLKQLQDIQRREEEGSEQEREEQNEYDEDQPRNNCITPTPMIDNNASPDNTRNNSNVNDFLNIHRETDKDKEQVSVKKIEDYIVFQDKYDRNGKNSKLDYAMMQKQMKSMQVYKTQQTQQIMKNNKKNRLESIMKLKTKKPVCESRYKSTEKSAQKSKKQPFDISDELQNYNSKSVTKYDNESASQYNTINNDNEFQNNEYESVQMQNYQTKLQEEQSMNFTKMREIEAYKKKILFNIERQAKQKQQNDQREIEQDEIQDNKKSFKYNEKQKEKEMQEKIKYQQESLKQKATITKLSQNQKRTEKKAYDQQDHYEYNKEYEWVQKKKLLNKQKEKMNIEIKQNELRQQQQQRNESKELNREQQMIEKEQNELVKIKRSNIQNQKQQQMMDHNFKEAKALLDIYEQNKKIYSLSHIKKQRL